MSLELGWWCVCLSQSWLFLAFPATMIRLIPFTTLIISSTCRTNAYNWTVNPVLSSSMTKTVLLSLSGRCPLVNNNTDVLAPGSPMGTLPMDAAVVSLQHLKIIFATYKVNIRNIQNQCLQHQICLKIHY